MYQRLDGEMTKVVKVDNGWLVHVWDPQAPKPTLPGQTPCSQQPVKWWSTYIFSQLSAAMTFVSAFLEGIDG